jgi:Zn-dependent protease
MMLAEPQPTPVDLRFSLGGIPVRVSVWFWPVAALFGLPACQAMTGGDRRELASYLAIWVGVVFGSILVHEFGHALAYRLFGQRAAIVLYQFGGLAMVPAWGRRGHLRPWQRLVVSAAGPAAQLTLAAAVAGLLAARGLVIPWPLDALGELFGVGGGQGFASRQTAALAVFLLSVNVLWPILNLVPVPPLDGGQIVREALASLGVTDAARIAAAVGVVAGGAVAWWGFTRREEYLGIMFAMLAVSCYQSLSASPPWRRWN